MSREVTLTLQELVVDHVHTTLHQEDSQWQPSLSEALNGMTAAQALYGVTMQEPGVSRLVSVKFNATAEAAA